jgi:membrane protein DedA with SNARE-associated domain/rhodanese-related sulfurtransferase
MPESTQFLINHGLPLVFAAVFLEQIGLPLPASPWLLAAGALSAIGKFGLLSAVWVAIIACLAADAIWFYLGRHRGNQVLGLLCRISLEPDSCVRRTQNVFTRYGVKGLVVAKFVPGFSTVAPPLAGMSGMSIGQFLLFDGLGSLLYGGCFILLGYFFSNQIQQILEALASVGGSALRLIVVVAIGYIGFKYWQRHRLLRELRMARVTVEELRQKQKAGEDVVILDLRSSAALQEDPSLIQGAIHLSLEDIEKRSHEIPRDRDVIVYCSCPNEVTSARVALLLHKKGFTRVRPLLGGLDAWREQNYPMASRTSVLPGVRGSEAVAAEPVSLNGSPTAVLLPNENQPARQREGKVR